MKWHPRSFPKYHLSETCQSYIRGLSQVWVSVVQWLKEVHENIWISIDIDMAMQYSYCMCKVIVWYPKNKKISRNEEKGDDVFSVASSPPGLHHFHLVPSSSYGVTMRLVRNLLLLMRGSMLACLTGSQIWGSNLLFQPTLLLSLVFSSLLDFRCCTPLLF